MSGPAQSGMSLIELLVAIAVGALVLAGLNSVLSLGLSAQTDGRLRSDAVFEARFALERMVAAARGVAPKLLATPTAGTTGNWFAPAGCAGAACVMYCLNAGRQLVETTTADSGCAAGTPIASAVTAFAAQLPAGAGPVDRPLATLSLTLDNGTATQVLATSVRLGGGTR